ncbi:hypothetical protein RJ640_019934 [Escallonia rubra]|uniref:Uncharacterized protein n=1 Tax=Escallonia rubra TaxID=112253 RepID=A0AA88Q7T2_9ASTE|nr:hypothetical protein RJ640_019934 [Escallonia rubra]
MFPPAILCVFVAYLTFFSTSPVAGDDTPTAYEVLEDYGFPVGLLPKGVTGYELNSTTGKFKAYLNGSCSFSIEGYKLRYKSTISGVITEEKLKSLKGISVKVLLQITRDSQPMSGIIIFTLSLLYLSPFIASIAVADGGDSFSAYEILQSYDFPVGILPKGAKGYDLDDTTGKFHAYFSGACSFSLEGSYQLRYKSTISGSISKDRLTNLSGVSVKVLFLWLNIVEVVRNGDVLEFSVGIASAKFTIDSFDVSPQCGCGFNCNNIGQVTKLRKSAFVSSL